MPNLPRCKLNSRPTFDIYINKLINLINQRNFIETKQRKILSWWYTYVMDKPSADVIKFFGTVTSVVEKNAKDEFSFNSVKISENIYLNRIYRISIIMTQTSL